MKRAKPEFSRNFSYLLKLLSCVLNDINAPEPNDDTDWASVFSMAEYHNVTGILYCAVMKLPAHLRPSEGILAPAREQYRIELVKDINVDLETEKLLSDMGKAGVKTLPLKGYTLKKDYPIPSLRTMSDVDVLFENAHKDKVITILKSNGYTILSDNADEIDVYKEPFHHYEFHSKPGTSGRFTCDFFDDVWGHALINQQLRGSLSADDFYIYMLEHFAKHLEAGGAGIRMVMDIYVFLTKHREELSEDYLINNLSALHLDEFRCVAENMAFNWFQRDCEPDTDNLIADYILCSCTFGKSADAIVLVNMRADKKRGKKSSPFNNISRRIFPRVEYIAKHYPILNKCKMLYPLMVAAYWLRRLFGKGDISTANIKHYLKTSDSEEAIRLHKIMTDMRLTSRF